VAEIPDLADEHGDEPVAADEEKSAMAQCGALRGDAKSQCKKNAEAMHDKAMADAKADLEKAKADYKATK
jgi:hypothetical protein